ncbi:MAG: hypothetical protein ACI8XO_000904 [Verrucomicrobiales bacterium]|jgi:hypothetical protein
MKKKACIFSKRVQLTRRFMKSRLFMNLSLQTRQPDSGGETPKNCSELRRRCFLMGAAAALAGSAISCSPSRSSLSGGKKKISFRGGVHSHPTYQSFLSALRLRNVPPERVMAPHFRKRGHVSNCVPPKVLWSNIAPTLRVANEIARRCRSPLEEICSAYRSPSYNRHIGGASKSQHMRNTALDLKFACGSWEASKIARQLRNEGYFAGGIGIYSGFLHIDTRGTNETWWA